MNIIYSIWHSTKSWEFFKQEIDNVWFDYLVDVRSIPYSRWNPQYNKNRIQEKLWDKYIFMWDSLWWMDENISKEIFLKGVEKLSTLAKDYIVVFFCSEKDYTKCHRFFKITKELVKKDLTVQHL